MKPPRVVQVAYNPTARLYKQSAALCRNGLMVDLISHDPPNVIGAFDTVTLWSDDGQLRRSMRRSDADIFHVHNQPDELVKLVAKDSRPVVVDVHDLFSVLTGEIRADERDMYSFGDAFLHVSHPMMDHFRSIHGNGKPDAVVENYISEDLVLREKPRRYPGSSDKIRMVYEGAVTGGGTDKLCDEAPFAYYDHRDTAKELQAAGIELHMYPARYETGIEAHKQFGVTVHEGRPLAKLIPEMQQYRWGLVGNTNRFKQWDVSMPNKLFEYMAAGIPVVVWNAAEAAKFVEREGVGIVVNSAEEIVARNGEAEKCQEAVLAKIKGWTWEANIHRLEKLYAKVLHG